MLKMTNSSEQDPTFSVDNTGDGVRFILPVRQMGSAKLLCIPYFVFAGLFLSPFLYGMVKLMTDPSFTLLPAQTLPLPGKILFWVCYCTFAFLGGGIPFILGLWMVLPTHGEITINKRYISYKECGGILHWTFKRNVQQIDTVNVGRVYLSPRPNQNNMQILAKEITLNIYCRSERRMIIARRYPKAVLELLAQAITEQINIQAPIDAQDAKPSYFNSPTKLDIEASPDIPAPTVVPACPITDIKINTGISRYRDEKMTTILVPRPGLKSSWTFIFVLGSVVSLAFIIPMIISVISAIQKGQPTLTAISPALVLSPFIGIGLFFVYLGLNGLLSKQVFVVTPRQLNVTTSELLRQKEQQWSSDEISSITISPSNIRVATSKATPGKFQIQNNQLMQLLIHTKDGRQYQLLTGRTFAEIEWVAAILRLAHSLS